MWQSFTELNHFMEKSWLREIFEKCKAKSVLYLDTGNMCREIQHLYWAGRQKV